MMSSFSIHTISRAFLIRQLCSQAGNILRKPGKAADKGHFHKAVSQFFYHQFWQSVLKERMTISKQTKGVLPAIVFCLIAGKIPQTFCSDTLFLYMC
jgi:hypothetical protein